MTEIKIFDKWPVEGVEIRDIGLRNYINLDASLIPKTRGRMSKHKLHKSKMNIVERLMNKMMVPGHRGKKHLISSGRASGKSFTVYKIIKSVFEKIEKETGKNPIEVLVGAVENTAVREEVTSYQVGGTIVRKAVITSPQRRVDHALSKIVQASYRKSFGKKDSMADVMTGELIGAYNNDKSKSEGIAEKERIEREAEGAR